MGRPEVVALKKAIKLWKTLVDANHERIDECFVCMYRNPEQAEFCETTILCKRRENTALGLLIEDAEARIALAGNLAPDEVAAEDPVDK